MRWGEWIWLTGPSGLHRNSPQGLNISSIRVFDQIRDPESPIPLSPLLNPYYSEYYPLIFRCFLLFYYWSLRTLIVTILYHYFYSLHIVWGRRVIGISGSLIWSKTLMELIFNPCCEFWWSPEGPVSQIYSPHLLVGAPGIFSDLLRFI